jgi:putative peptidoglycan lipid II flippase
MAASFRNNILWTVSLSGCTFIFSFASLIVISYFYGTSAELDAYWAAFAIVNLLVFPVHPFREALVPEIHRRSLEASPKNASEYFSKALTLILIIASVGLVVSWIFPEFLSRLVVSASAEHLQLLVSRQILWFAPAIILLALSETLNSLLASYHALILQSVSRLLAAGSSLAIIAMMAGVVGIKALVLGFMGGQLIAVALLLIVVRKHGLVFRFTWPSNLGKAFLILSGALLVNYSAGQIYFIYEKYIFSAFSKGAISSFQYGVSLTNVLITILGLSLANVFWPRFLQYAANNDLEKASKEMTVVLKIVLLGMGVICSIIYLNADTIINMLFMRGAFDAESAVRTSQALRATIFTAIPVTAASLLGRALISFGVAKKVMLIGIATALCGILILWISQSVNSYELAITHWLLANLVNFIVSGVLFLKLQGCHTETYIKSAWWITRSLLVFSIAIYLTQSSMFFLFQNEIGINVGIISAITITAISAALVWGFGLSKNLKISRYAK